MSAVEVAVGVLIMTSAFLSMAAGIGIIRVPDVLTRLHAATKPQVLGLAVALLAIGTHAQAVAVRKEQRARRAAEKGRTP